MRLCRPPVGSTVPSISCCVLNHLNLFYLKQNPLDFNRDMSCHLALCLQLLPFHCTFYKINLAICFPCYPRHLLINNFTSLPFSLSNPHNPSRLGPNIVTVSIYFTTSRSQCHKTFYGRNLRMHLLR
jgi:hypothetical protein